MGILQFGGFLLVFSLTHKLTQTRRRTERNSEDSKIGQFPNQRNLRFNSTKMGMDGVPHNTVRFTINTLF